MRYGLSLLPLVSILFCTNAQADVVLAARTIRAHEILTLADLVVGKGDVPGAYQNAEAVAGQEARVILYAGRPVRSGEIGPAALIERNQIVPMIFTYSGLRIAAEGRALSRAAVGETIRVMNLSSRTTVSGFVQADGTVRVVR